MLENVIAELIRKDRPYYLPQGSPIKGIDNQYWLVFKHRDADSILKNIASFFGLGSKKDTHHVIRIDLQDAKIYHYIPNKQGDIPSVGLLRIGNVKSIEKFLKRDRVTKEPALLEGSLRAIKGNQRRYNLPDELGKYNIAIAQMLERSSIYRRSTAYFDSGILKFYEEPLQSIIQTDGRILLLIDWQGFTKKSDISELEKLQDPDYRAQFAQRTLQEFLQGLADSTFSHTEILAELVRLEFLQIKLIKMEQGGRAIYHKKTGIFSDSLDNHILHEGSDNFTRAAHSRNAESVTFLYSWEDLDGEAIAQSIQQFDQEWHRQDLAFDISLEFLQQVRAERDRRAQFQQPNIKTISPDQFPSGETTEVEITGDNLDQVTQVTVIDDPLVEVTITEQTKDLIKAEVEVSPDAEGLNSFLLEHYEFSKPVQTKIEIDYEADFFMEDEDYEEEEEENTDPETSKETKRQQLRTQINKATDALIDHPEKAQQIYALMLAACEQDLVQMEQIQNLLADEFLKDHKREQVTQQVKTLISQGKKVLLISTFSDTVLDYYLHMSSRVSTIN